MSQPTANNPCSAGGKNAVFNDLPVAASTHLYDGAILGSNAGNMVNVNAASYAFAGIAVEEKDNTGGSAGDKVIHVLEEGIAFLSVVGVASVADVGKTVYASDGSTPTLTAAGAVSIGRVKRWISGTLCEVFVQAVNLRLPHRSSGLTNLTDNSGGATPDSTIGVVTLPTFNWNGSTDPSAAQATAINAAFTALTDAVAELAAKVNALNAVLAVD